MNGPRDERGPFVFATARPRAESGRLAAGVMNRCDRCVVCATSLWLSPRMICCNIAPSGRQIGNHVYVKRYEIATYTIVTGKHESCFPSRARRTTAAPAPTRGDLTETANRSRGRGAKAGFSTRSAHLPKRAITGSNCRDLCRAYQRNRRRRLD